MRLSILVSLALLLSGAALVVVSVAHGGASVALYVIVPVVSGSSLGFLLGVGLLIAGFFALPFALADRGDWTGPHLSETGPSTESSEHEGGFGGFVLIGPVPIVFGSWKGISRRARWLLALVGALLLTVVIVAFALVLG